MTLYEINQEVTALLDKLGIDPETGEVVENSDEIMARLSELELDRQAVLESLAKAVLNIRADAKALKEEEQRLKERRDALSRKEERIMKMLDRECAGQKTALGVATFNYRKTTRVDVTDNLAAVTWLQANGHADCYRVSDPEISKTEVKKLIAQGVDIPGCSIVEGYSKTLK